MPQAPESVVQPPSACNILAMCFAFVLPLCLTLSACGWVVSCFANPLLPFLYFFFWGGIAFAVSLLLFQWMPKKHKSLKKWNKLKEVTPSKVNKTSAWKIDKWKRHFKRTWNEIKMKIFIVHILNDGHLLHSITRDCMPLHTSWQGIQVERIHKILF